MLSLTHTPDMFLFVAKAVVEMTILWVVFYRVLLFFEGTRAFQVLKGITYLIIALLFSQILGASGASQLAETRAPDDSACRAPGQVSSLVREPAVVTRC